MIHISLHFFFHICYSLSNSCYIYEVSSRFPYEEIKGEYAHLKRQLLKGYPIKNKDLIAVLESLSPEAEIGVEVNDILTGNHLAYTYDIGFTLTEN